MSKKEKLIARLKTKPKDFTYYEMKTLLEYLGFVENKKGKTAGSRVEFVHKDSGYDIDLHRPHPKNILKPYQIQKILKELSKMGEI